MSRSGLRSSISGGARTTTPACLTMPLQWLHLRGTVRRRALPRRAHQHRFVAARGCTRPLVWPRRGLGMAGWRWSGEGARLRAPCRVRRAALSPRLLSAAQSLPPQPSSRRRPSLLLRWMGLLEVGGVRSRSPLSPPLSSRRPSWWARTPAPLHLRAPPRTPPSSAMRGTIFWAVPVRARQARRREWLSEARRQGRLRLSTAQLRRALLSRAQSRRAR